MRSDRGLSGRGLSSRGGSNRGGWNAQVRKRIDVDTSREPIPIATAVLNEVFAHAREAIPEEFSRRQVVEVLQAYYDSLD